MTVLPACGTNAAYQYHLNHDEPVDEACRQAAREYHVAYREANPDKVAEHLATSRARYQALVLLAGRYPAEYAELLTEERAARGLPPPRLKS